MEAVFKRVSTTLSSSLNRLTLTEGPMLEMAKQRAALQGHKAKCVVPAQLNQNGVHGRLPSTIHLALNYPQRPDVGQLRLAPYFAKAP